MNKVDYKKSWFIPCLRSKYATIELLKLLFKYKYQVVLFLRQLCKGSEYFLDRFYEDEVKDFFEVHPISVRIPLVSGVMNQAALEEDGPTLAAKLTSYTNLIKIYEFQDCFELSIAVEINKFQRGIHTVDVVAQSTLIEIITNEKHEYNEIKFVLNLDADSSVARSANMLSDPNADHIFIFLNKLIDVLPSGQQIYTQDLVLYDVDQRYVGLIISAFYNKE